MWNYYITSVPILVIHKTNMKYVGQLKRKKEKQKKKGNKDEPNDGAARRRTGS